MHLKAARFEVALHHQYSQASFAEFVVLALHQKLQAHSLHRDTSYSGCIESLAAGEQSCGTEFPYGPIHPEVYTEVYARVICAPLDETSTTNPQLFLA